MVKKDAKLEEEETVNESTKTDWGEINPLKMKFIMGQFFFLKEKTMKGGRRKR